MWIELFSECDKSQLEKQKGWLFMHVLLISRYIFYEACQLLSLWITLLLSILPKKLVKQLFCSLCTYKDGKRWNFTCKLFTIYIRSRQRFKKSIKCVGCKFREPMEYIKKNYAHAFKNKKRFFSLWLPLYNCLWCTPTNRVIIKANRN